MSDRDRCLLLQLPFHTHLEKQFLTVCLNASLSLQSSVKPPDLFISHATQSRQSACKITQIYTESKNVICAGEAPIYPINFY